VPTKTVCSGKENRGSGGWHGLQTPFTIDNRENRLKEKREDRLAGNEIPAARRLNHLCEAVGKKSSTKKLGTWGIRFYKASVKGRPIPIQLEKFRGKKGEKMGAKNTD